MLNNIVVGALLTLVTTVIHALFTAGLIRFLRTTRTRGRVPRTTGSRVLVISLLVLALFLISMLEAGVWAAAYVAVAALQDFEAALYFSIVTFTTLGYGDITLGEPWRLLASLQAANGTLIFGWTTALIVAALRRMIPGEQEE